MELSTSELSIYDKLSETIDLVRQTGYQCGMSEKAIEKFIKQLLEKNEPQRGPPRFPLLMVLYKGLVTLGVVLLTAYFMIQPYTLSPSESTLTKIHPWGSLFHHIRLLPLPITKKYMLENKMSSKRKSYSTEFKKGIVEDSQSKNLTAFCKVKMLDLRLVRKWRAEYDNLSQRCTREMLRSASVDQVGNRYFLNLKTASLNGSLTGEQRLWLYAGLIFKHWPLQWHHNYKLPRKNSEFLNTGWLASFNDMNCL